MKATTAPTENEAKAQVLKTCHGFIITETELNDERISDVLKAVKACADKTSAEYEILTKEANVLAIDIAGELACLDNIVKDYERAEAVSAQRAFEVDMEISKAKVNTFKQNYDGFCEERAALPIGKNLAEQYRHNPQDTAVLKAAAKDIFFSVDETDFLYFSKSSFVHDTYGVDFGINNEQFFQNASEQLHNLKNVMSQGGVAVEICSCEQFGEKLLFTAGTVMHPAAVQDAFSNLEREVRELKMQAEVRGDYYPYFKCEVTIYVFTEQAVSALRTRIEIGDGEQDGLLEHLHQCCCNVNPMAASQLASIETAFESALEECGRDKLLLPKPITAVPEKRKTMSLAELEGEIISKRLEQALEQVAVSQEESTSGNAQERGARRFV